MIPADVVTKAREMSIVDVALALGAADGVKVNERGVPCPHCGGRDRFSVDHGKNVFLCRASGAGGDPIALVQHVSEVSFAEAIEQLTGERAIEARRAPERNDEQQNWYREKARHRAWNIWQNGAPIEPERRGRIVRDYFSIRAIPFPAWRIKALREAAQLPYWHFVKHEFVVVHSGPAMLAAITGPDGRFMGVHRTWLDLSRPNGKAAIADPETGEILDAKKVEGSQKGGKIVLRNSLDRANEPMGGLPVAAASLTAEETGQRGEAAKIAMPGSAKRGPATILAVGEGIETVLSWDALNPGNDAALWVGINIGNIAGKAAEQIPHPSLTDTDRIGRTRRRKVGGQEPDPADTDCLQVPFGLFDRLTLLGDSDSDRFTTQAAMLRAKKRFELAGHSAEVDWAPDGQDFNDQLRGRRETRHAGRAA
ncbi:CHC2 zinc finger domain-containing protein [Mesorhizobium sp.]|uniref:DUF7146 domain-containing protein n=1 Tax=Mesorhizobium sp. TaxID=1871066 RepID=UPI00120F7A3A|nr:CHC2 zinc finger domain-containing protein [Mesorhizobium sp.]TIN84334.1 MAG: hypothetical protein E5X97_22440 [Mesorhizobium sp.]